MSYQGGQTGDKDQMKGNNSQFAQDILNMKEGNYFVMKSSGKKEYVL